MSRSAGDWEGSRRRGPIPSMAVSVRAHPSEEPEGSVSPRAELKISPKRPGKAEKIRTPRSRVWDVLSYRGRSM